MFFGPTSLKMSAMTIDSPDVTSQIDILCSSILTSNFDAVSTPALLLLFKIIVNIQANPQDAKFRQISRDSKALSCVVHCRGGLDFLLACGFSSDGTKYVLPVAGEGGEGQEARLAAAAASLQASLDQLNVPKEDRAQPKARPATQTPAALAPAPAAAFDLFKSNFRKVSEIDGGITVKDGLNPFASSSSGPGSSNSSSSSSGSSSSSSSRISSSSSSGGGSGGGINSMDEQLVLLSKRREELEGRVEDVERLTEVILYSPHERAPVGDMDTAHNEDDPKATGAGSSSSSSSSFAASDPSLMSALKNRLLHPAENAPLTTRTVRELAKAKTARVYARALVRVRLPDKSLLQGYFHPREGLWEVYLWVSQCLVPPEQFDPAYTPTGPSLSSSSSSSKKNKNPYPFELYTTPPRQVHWPIAPYSASLQADLARSQRAGIAGTAPAGHSLLELQLAPACLLNLAWTADLPEGYRTASAGRMVREEIMSRSDGKDGPRAQYPVGEKLVSGDRGGAAGGARAKEGSQEESRAEGKGTKPKWLKI